MPKLRKSRIREERIHNEIVVDVYGPEEQSLGWYYYLENNIKLPFTALSGHPTPANDGHLKTGQRE